MQRQKTNEVWLENLAVHVITVLVLDRFADFIGDEVRTISTNLYDALYGFMWNVLWIG